MSWTDEDIRKLRTEKAREKDQWLTRPAPAEKGAVRDRLLDRLLSPQPTVREVVDKNWGRMHRPLPDQRTSPVQPLFDPTLPEDAMLQKSMGTWVGDTAAHNTEYIDRGEADRQIRGPLGPLQKVLLKARRTRPEEIDKGIDYEFLRREMSRRHNPGMLEDIYRRALDDPNRPVQDASYDSPYAPKLSPTHYNPRTGEYDLVDYLNPFPKLKGLKSFED